MKFLWVYLKLYGRCGADALAGILKAPWTLLLPVGIGLVFQLVLAPLLAPLGRAGGFLLGIAFAFLVSCYLYFLGGVVAKQAVSLRELKTSFLTYIWSVMNLGFVLWIGDLALGYALGNNRNAAAFQGAFNLALLVLLNCTPEVIYLKGSVGGIETIQRSVRFLQENWIEWFVPNGLFIAGAWYLPELGLPSQAVIHPQAWLVSSGIVGGLIGHVVMVFRGQLFSELDGSTHRQRMFKYGRPS